MAFGFCCWCCCFFFLMDPLHPLKMIIYFFKLFLFWCANKRRVLLFLLQFPFVFCVSSFLYHTVCFTSSSGYRSLKIFSVTLLTEAVTDTLSSASQVVLSAAWCQYCCFCGYLGNWVSKLVQFTLLLPRCLCWCCIRDC